jgi:hypothetical protein
MTSFSCHVCSIPAFVCDIPLYAIAPNDSWAFVAKFFRPDLELCLFCRRAGYLTTYIVNLQEKSNGEMIQSYHSKCQYAPIRYERWMLDSTYLFQS